MPDIQTTISTISEDQINALFGDEPLKLVDETNIALGNVKVTKETKDDVFKVQDSKAEIPFFDADKLDDEEEIEGKKEEEKIEDKKDENKKEEKKEEEKKTSKKAEEAKVGDSELDVLRNTAKYLISKGKWKDFENSEEIINSLTEETYAELVEQQDEIRLQEKHSKKIEETGDYGKAIFEYIENGGNPDELIDLFKEQKEIEIISKDTEEGKKQLIEKYYTEVFDWSPEKTKKYINNLISTDELDGEADEVDAKYKSYFKAQLEQAQLQQQAAKKAELDRQKAFAQTINTKLSERKDFTDKERKLIQEAVFKYDAVLPDGTKVNKFYQKFAEMQKNPDDYLDLVNFVMNKDGYNAKVKKADGNQQVDKKWSFIAKNGAITTKGSVQESNNSQKKVLDFDWSIK